MQGVVVGPGAWGRNAAVFTAIYGDCEIARELSCEAAVLPAMQDTTRSPRNRGLWSKWPATTISALTGLTALALLMLTHAPVAGEVDSEAAAKVEEEREAEVSSASPASSEIVATLPGPSKLESVMSPKSKSGLYAMKGPRDAAAAGPSPAAADDSDVWGGIEGVEVGESFGVGGLGLVGTGRGGGGTGDIVGTGSGYGRGARGMDHRRYDRTLQSRVLTVGTVDDNADANAYATALTRLGADQGVLGIDAALWNMAPPQQRHVAQPGGLDVALVIDTTGSMGDELEYLKVEVRDIAEQVSRSYPGVAQRWGLVVYRDRGDDYVTRSMDFGDIDAFVEKLGKQQAGGGGDMPEAMDVAMDASAKLSWRTGADTARMVFLVADAPTHEGVAARRFASAVLEHRSDNTAIYPVGASGVHTEAEAEMRLAAKVTGGQYIFLTDHSGVGGHHDAPKVEQYKVETLHDAMARMIDRELGDASVRVRTPRLLAVDTRMPSLAVVDDLDTLVQAPTPVDVWDSLRALLADRVMLALSMLMMVLAGMGFDTLIHRWRGR